LGGGGQFPALRLRLSGLDPNTNYIHDHGGHRSTGLIVLNKLSPYGISLDAQACDVVEERRFSNRPIFYSIITVFDIIPSGIP